METPVLLVDHSLPAEHRADDQLSTAVCDVVVSTAATLLAGLDASDAMIVEYDEGARWSDLQRLNASRWAYIYGTNLQAGLILSRAAFRGPGRILVLAHSRPSAHLAADGMPFFNLPPVSETAAATASEIERCTQVGIRVDVIVVPPGTETVPLPWPANVVSAVGLGGGSFTQTATSAELSDVVEFFAAG